VVFFQFALSLNKNQFGILSLAICTSILAAACLVHYSANNLLVCCELIWAAAAKKMNTTESFSVFCLLYTLFIFLIICHRHRSLLQKYVSLKHCIGIWHKKNQVRSAQDTNRYPVWAYPLKFKSRVYQENENISNKLNRRTEKSKTGRCFW
jgi:hypothetical protein